MIIHNLIVKMQKRGELVDERDGDRGTRNVLTEFLDAEVGEKDANAFADPPQNYQAQTEQDNLLHHARDCFEQNLLLHTHLTSGRGFERLKSKLVKNVWLRFKN